MMDCLLLICQRKRLKGIICLSKPSVFFPSCFSKNNCVLILLILYLSISWLKDMSQIHFLNIWFEVISGVEICNSTLIIVGNSERVKRLKNDSMLLYKGFDYFSYFVSAFKYCRQCSSSLLRILSYDLKYELPFLSMFDDTWHLCLIRWNNN